MENKLSEDEELQLQTAYWAGQMFNLPKEIQWSIAEEIVKALQAKEDEIKKLKDKWISIDDRLPDLEEVVIVQNVLYNGELSVWQGQRREVAEVKRIDGIFQSTGKRIIEWGYDENGEYWTKLDVTYWQPFPEIKK